ncbi:aldehyde dehydrogenase family protein [Pseudomaricurvus alkylphenolicus]|uniref:aldehyde dehydrogenase family protein n=1 Tax=Pseudomaricurvus alkylphenolicus TaxID=1306991 RepID=UPI0014205CCF|nr:aldehyde dehydrogenase family protein [Pseudomaricurvus alkylphenolicus]NIB38298.1 aldehyde dehydrogenase family protein [Pseudomaricurvus alkylphenolicus]
MNKHFELVIDGKGEAGAEACFDVINPATAEVVAQCPCGSTEQLDQAVAAAKQAFVSWRRSSDAERRALLHRIADDIESRCDELARLIVEEQGKPLALAESEVMGGVAWTRYNAELDIPVEVVEETSDKRIELHRKPLGVVASITPWNWPFMIAVWHIMPALRTGNTVVSKPSEFTPLSTLRLVEIINLHVPPGVINIVTGAAAIGAAITEHSFINKIIFTGSTQTGQHIMRGAAGNLKRLTLELGGNDAGIVLPDTHPAQVCEDIFQAAFLNMGQTCAALKRLYVHESQYQDFCERLTRIAEQQVVGNGLDEGVNFGPIQNARQFDKVAKLVEDAKQQGATVLCGGEAIKGAGYFYPPTIVANITDGTALVDEEQFGPVLPIIAYRDVNDAVARANASDSGLGGSVWSSDSDAAKEIASQLESGVSWVNCHAQIQPNTPFGGCKMSGFGVEFGLEGLLEYTSHHLLYVNK